MDKELPIQDERSTEYNDPEMDQRSAEIDFTIDDGKEWLNPSREKNKGTHSRKKVDEKFCVTFLLCDPGWYVQRT